MGKGGGVVNTCVYTHKPKWHCHCHKGSCPGQALTSSAVTLCWLLSVIFRWCIHVLICIMYLPPDASEINKPQLICIMYLPPDASERNKPQTSFHCFVWFYCGYWCFHCHHLDLPCLPLSDCTLSLSPHFSTHTHTHTHTHTICACVVDIQTGNEQVHCVGVFIYSPQCCTQPLLTNHGGGGGGGGVELSMKN